MKMVKVAEVSMLQATPKARIGPGGRVGVFVGVLVAVAVSVAVGVKV